MYISFFILRSIINHSTRFDTHIFAQLKATYFELNFWYVNFFQIKWFKFSQNEKKPVEVVTTECSVYDLKKHSKFVFPPGIIVKSKPAQDERMGKVIDSCVEVLLLLLINKIT